MVRRALSFFRKTKSRTLNIARSTYGFTEGVCVNFIHRCSTAIRLSLNKLNSLVVGIAEHILSNLWTVTNKIPTTFGSVSAFVKEKQVGSVLRCRTCISLLFSKKTTLSCLAALKALFLISFTLETLPASVYITVLTVITTSIYFLIQTFIFFSKTYLTKRRATKKQRLWKGIHTLFWSMENLLYVAITTTWFISFKNPDTTTEYPIVIDYIQQGINIWFFNTTMLPLLILPLPFIILIIKINKLKLKVDHLIHTAVFFLLPVLIVGEHQLFVNTASDCNNFPNIANYSTYVSNIDGGTAGMTIAEATKLAVDQYTSVPQSIEMDLVGLPQTRAFLLIYFIKSCHAIFIFVIFGNPKKSYKGFSAASQNYLKINTYNAVFLLLITTSILSYIVVLYL